VRLLDLRELEHQVVVYAHVVLLEQPPDKWADRSEHQRVGTDGGALLTHQLHVRVLFSGLLDFRHQVHMVVTIMQRQRCGVAALRVSIIHHLAAAVQQVNENEIRGEYRFVL